MDFSKLDDGSGLTTEAKLQKELAGDQTLLIFQLENEAKPFHEEVFSQGLSFDWVKNKVAEKMFASYEDLSLWMNEKRIPEPVCLVDMGVKSGQLIIVKVAEGAIVGEEAMRQKVLAEMEEENKGGEAFSDSDD